MYRDVIMWISVTFAVVIGLVFTGNPFCLLTYLAPVIVNLFGRTK